MLINRNRCLQVLSYSWPLPSLAMLTPKLGIAIATKIFWSHWLHNCFEHKFGTRVSLLMLSVTLLPLPLPYDTDLLKKAFLAGLTVLLYGNPLSTKQLSSTPLNCISINNQKCKVRPEIINVNRDEPVFLFILLVLK